MLVKCFNRKCRNTIESVDRTLKFQINLTLKNINAKNTVKCQCLRKQNSDINLYDSM